jgi:hypothetical protein
MGVCIFYTNTNLTLFLGISLLFFLLRYKNIYKNLNRTDTIENFENKKQNNFIFKHQININNRDRYNEKLREKKRSLITIGILSILLIFAFWSPIDLCFRFNSSFSFEVHFVPLIAVYGAYGEIRELEYVGLKANKDFVVYYQQSWSRHPKYVFLILLPYCFHP